MPTVRRGLACSRSSRESDESQDRLKSGRKAWPRGECTCRWSDILREASINSSQGPFTTATV